MKVQCLQLRNKKDTSEFLCSFYGQIKSWKRKAKRDKRGAPGGQETHKKMVSRKIPHQRSNEYEEYQGEQEVTCPPLPGHHLSSV